MIHEQRVRLETWMSVYEQRRGTKDAKINGYFKNDYIGSQFLWTFISVTIAFFLILGVYAFYNFEDLMLTVYSIDPAGILFRLSAIYIVVLIAFLTITYFVYSRRYDEARKNLNRYSRDLKKLSSHRRREEKVRV